MLKQALCIANEQLHRYEFLVNAIAAIIFISTPHAASTKDDTYNLFANVVNAVPKKLGKTHTTQTGRENTLLWDLANRFEGIYFRTPVLSVYETKQSRISERPFKSRVKTVSLLPGLRQQICKSTT